MSLSRWEPFNDLVSLREAMDRLLEESFVRPGRSLLAGTGGNCPLDVWQTEKEIFVKATVPGIKPEDLDISVTGDALTIRGELKSEESSESRQYFVQERRSGSFQRTVSLPAPVESDGAEATFEHGVLTLRLPKAASAQPRRIAVRGADTPRSRRSR
ncbi:MAG: Hsp20/alpha crystallin family protein [Chloroflexi bacterium]|nr:Hsp20/alpha crystallin family protein [Chloroflexota bacterium]